MDAREYLEFLNQLHHVEVDQAAYKEAQTEWLKQRSGQLGNPSGEDAYPTAVFRALNPSPEQISDLITTILLEPFVRTLPNDAQEALASIPLGVLPIRAVNAHVVRAPSGEPLILMNQALLNMVSYYMEVKMGVAALYMKKEFEVANKYLNYSYAIILGNFEKLGSDYPTPSQMVRLSPEMFALAMMETLAVETFVIAHELAHVYAGHLEGSAVHEVEIGRQDRRSVQFYQLSRQQEYEADRLGWMWYQQALPDLAFAEDLLTFAPVAPLGVFVLLALVEKNFKNADAYSTHPSSMDRVLI
jgi:hypothetical protein